MRLLLVSTLSLLTACVSGGGLGSDWLYRETSDPVSRNPSTFAMLTLPSEDFTNEPSYLAATCDQNGFEFFVASEGYWGESSPFFRKNQTFEMRVGDKIFQGHYLASVEGDSAYLVSNNPTFKAVDPQKLIDAFSGANSIAVRVADYRGSTSTVSRSVFGNSEGLVRVAADCGLR